MPAYNYKCTKCGIIHEEIHKMDESPAIRCPECEGPCEKTLEGVRITTYVRGNGFLDRAGCKRDMHLYHLQQNDPYKQHRAPGEADYIADKLRKGGKKPKNTKYFTPRK